jgi:hypothetical protein
MQNIKFANTEAALEVVVATSSPSGTCWPDAIVVGAATLRNAHHRVAEGVRPVDVRGVHRYLVRRVQPGGR